MPRMLATRAAFLSGHDISQSHAVQQLNASLLFFPGLTSSFTRGNDLPPCRMTFTCWAPVLLRFRRKEKKKKNGGRGVTVAVVEHGELLKPLLRFLKVSCILAYTHHPSRCLLH